MPECKIYRKAMIRSNMYALKLVDQSHVMMKWGHHNLMHIHWWYMCIQLCVITYLLHIIWPPAAELPSDDAPPPHWLSTLDVMPSDNTLAACPTVQSTLDGWIAWAVRNVLRIANLIYRFRSMISMISKNISFSIWPSRPLWSPLLVHPPHHSQHSPFTFTQHSQWVCDFLSLTGLPLHSPCLLCACHMPHTPPKSAHGARLPALTAKCHWLNSLNTEGHQGHHADNCADASIADGCSFPLSWQQ